jgi:NADH-quinone oxidoreductase subunit L
MGYEFWVNEKRRFALDNIALLGLLIAALPLAAFVVIVTFTKKMRMTSAVISISAIAAAFVMSIIVLISEISQPGLHGVNIPWMRVSNVELNMGVMVNQLTAIMFIVVTFVSFMVQVYSVGYMHGDEGFAKFFAFISLFSFSMLGIVISNNLMQIYVFWELVGLCSYLLIGFWYAKPEASDAAKKAFVVNRVGDFGFFLGIIMVSFRAGTFDFIKVEEFVRAGGIDPGMMTVIALLLFCGAVGKSAQFPLHVWLPDAMEGPTPVSALIHAATMVAAGVFMVARLFGIFSVSPDAMQVIAYTGGFTAIFAASIALTQDDIKRVLAYSTLSQLGYMVMVLGAGGYTAGMFHLFTHAFFKALLFLGAGSVIHAMHTNNIWEMGGLHRKMPVTSVTFLIAALAISGIFPLAGFWSKDEILVTLSQSGHKVLYYTAIITAFMTAFYMFRLWILTFLGEQHDPDSHAHESPAVMTVPLMILAFMSVVAGFAGAPGLPKNVFSFLYFGEPHEVEFNLGIAVRSNIVALCGIGLAFLIYGLKVIKAETMKKITGPLYVLSKNKFFVDEIYLSVIETVFFTLTEAVKWFDRHVVDGTVNLFSFLTRWSGIKLRYTMTGKVQNYALIIFAGLLIMIAAFALYNPDALRVLGGR